MWENTNISTIFGEKKGGKYRTGKLASSVTSQCLYHDVFTMYLRHFLPNDLYFLKYTIQQIITNSTSPPNRCTMTRSQFSGWFMDHYSQGNHSRFFLGLWRQCLWRHTFLPVYLQNKQWLSVLKSFHCSKSTATEWLCTIKRTVGNSLWGNYGRSEWIVVASCW